jgi:Carboxypeptidase regulatory-like domain
VQLDSSFRAFRFLRRFAIESSAVLALVLLVESPLQAAVAAGGAAVSVSVKGVDGAAIAGAKGMLKPNDGVILKCTSDSNGACTFSDVPPGFYRLRVAGNGYEDAERGFEIQTGSAQISIAVHLSKLLTIARIESKIDPASAVYLPNAGFGRIFVSLADQMNALGNANVQVSNGSLVGASLEGRDPSLTSTSFNGIAVQSAAALEAIDMDALAKARTDDQNIALELSTLGPAPFPVYEAQGTAGGNSMLKTKLIAQGTDGRVGFALAVVDHSEGNALSGQTFADTSGFTYAHQSTFRGRTFDARLDVPLSQTWTLRAEFLPRFATSNALSAMKAGPIPVGYGPYDNPETTHGSVSTLGLTGSIQDWSVNASVTAFHSSELDDFSNNYAAGVRLPYTQSSAGDESDAHVFGVRQIGPSGTINLNLNYSRSLSTSQISQPVAYLPGVGQLGSTRLLGDESYSVRTSHGRSYEFDLSQGRAIEPFAQSAMHANAKLTQTLGSGLEAFANLGAGSKLGELPSPGQFAPATTAEFNCGASSVIAQAPNDFPSVPNDRSLRIGFDRHDSSTSISVQGYWEGYRGILLSDGLVDAQSEPAGFAPPGYLAALAAAYDLVGGCTGTPRATYFQQNVAGVGVDYRGIEASLGHHFGKRLVFQSQVSLRDALLRGSDPRLSGAISPYIVGRELPNVPHFSGSASLEYRVLPTVDVLSNVVFSGGNNIYNLPPYALVTAGAVARLSPTASLNLIATNVTHQYVGAFTSSRYALSLPTVGGAPFATLAIPLVQPLLYVSVDFRWEHAPGF